MLDLQLFSGGHSVTLYNDSHITTATASASSDVQADAEVTLTVTPATGYEIGDYQVIAGGVTVDPATKKFTMGSSDVVIYITSKGANVYQVTEETMVCVNGVKQALHCNTKLILTPNGAPQGVTVDGTTVTVNDAIQQLVDQGVLVKL